MELIISWLVIPLLVLFVTGPVAASVFVALFAKNQRPWLAIFWVGLGAAAVLVGIYISHTFGNFFPGPGCFISLLTPLMVIMTILFLRFRARRLYQAIGDDKPRRRWLTAGMALIPLLQLSAPVISFGYGLTCELANRELARPIIASLEQYKSDTGGYLPVDSPDQSAQRDLTFLVPDYLASIPPRACTIAWLDPPKSASRLEDDWSLYLCARSPGREVLLMGPIIGSDSQQTYNLQTGNWSRGNWLDGFCNFK